MTPEEKKEYMKEWRKANETRLKKIDSERSLKWYYDNIEKAKITAKEYYNDNNIRLKNKQKEYYKINTNKAKEYQKEYRKQNKKNRYIKDKERKKIDPIYKLTCLVRSSINQAFRKNGYSKKSKTYEMLNCSYDTFKRHIESQFLPWMDWHNHGLYNGEKDYGWDIDHIIPLSSAKSEEELIGLFNFNNLRPLCSKINRDIKKNNLFLS